MTSSVVAGFAILTPNQKKKSNENKLTVKIFYIPFYFLLGEHTATETLLLP